MLKNLGGEGLKFNLLKNLGGGKVAGIFAEKNSGGQGLGLNLLKKLGAVGV